MKIGGWQKVSLIDYPERICTIIFTQGCNFRCPYCQNPELVDPAQFQQCHLEKDIFPFLESRTGKLDAVSITGGEPTIQPDLVEFIQRIKQLDYLIKVDTNGSRPDVLEKLINQGLLDYIAMDVKAPLKKYGKVVNAEVNPDRIKESIHVIMDSGVAYEFRTTVVESLLTKGDLQQIGSLIKNARLYVLQKFVASKSLDKEFMGATSFSDQDFASIKEKLKHDVQSIILR